VSLDGLHVAVAQVGARVGDPVANLELADRWAARAAARGADLLVLPECFVQGYALRPDVLALAEPADGAAVHALGATAARHGIALVAGFVERGVERPFNSAVVIDRDGRVAGAYRKTHLFGDENAAFAAGDALPVFPLCLAGDRDRPVPVGVCICADIEYPEVVRALALAGARIVTVPSADMEPFRVQQAANLASRAIENNLYVALANTVDRRRTVDFFGGSGIAGPDGSLVSAGYGRARLAVAELSDAAVEASGGPDHYLRTRRPELYRASAAD
jgi:predicted amidohydrolase